MDIKVVNLQKNKLSKLSKYTNEEKEKYLFNFLNLGLGLIVIKKDISLTLDIKGTIDFLCLDESYRLVIVEKRVDKFSRTIKNGLMYIDYIKENLSQIKMLISDSLGQDVAKEVCYDTRLVILTESFNSFDYSSIKCLPYTIEAINYAFLDNSLVFVKEYQNKNKEYDLLKGTLSELYLDLEDYLLSLGDEVCLWANKNVVSVRKIKVFSYIILLENELIIYLNNKEYSIKSNKDLDKIKEKLEKAYDEN